MELAQAHLLSGMTMGMPRAFAVSPDDLDSDQRLDRLLRSDVPDDVRRRLPGPDAARASGFSPPSRPGGLSPPYKLAAVGFWPLVPAAGLVAAVLVYGHFRTADVETDPGLKIALIQGNIDIQLDNPDDFARTTDSHYRELTHQGAWQPVLRRSI